MEEQGEGSKQILSAISKLKEVTEEVKNGSAEMGEGANQVITEGKNLVSLTEQITGGMNEMAIGAEQIDKSMNQVNEVSGQNKDSIGVLEETVGEFKIE
jgi:methyl-accepting chemotaxis protein